MAQFSIVNVVPNTHSNETWQDAEPSIAVNQNDPSEIVLTAFTPPDSGQTNGPIYYSQDGGSTWNLNFIVPGGEPGDQTFKFASRSNQFYGGDLSGSDGSLNALSTADPFVPGTLAILETNASDDQPFIEATTVSFGSDTGKDRVYLGHNDLSVTTSDGGTGKTSAVDVCLDAAVASPTYFRVHIDQRSTGTAGQDGPQVRTAVHSDGTVYALFAGWRSVDTTVTPLAFTTDVVVVRDDNWASGSSPFTALVEPPAPAGDGVAGVRVQKAISLFFDASGGQTGHLNAGAVGQERVAGAFAIAVDPRDSDIVIICWANIVSSAYTLNVQRSTDRGSTWSPVSFTVTNGLNPALAIASTGKIGLLYQKYTGTAPNDKFETHFAESINGSTWTDTILATTPAGAPVLNSGEGLTYIGDYLDLVAVGKNFYGAFCANNTPDPANFPATPASASNPNGAIFLRNVTAAAPWNLLGTDGHTQVAVSIDPFFVNITELPAYSDFYVRDWTDSTTSADTGLEPSTHADFYSTSDVWNQVASSTPNPPNSNDQPVGENAQAGSDNYAFARIRRNVLPPGGSGSTTVTAHFLVSEFGTGSNFVDWLFSDPSDPDITFPSPSDVTVSFGPTDLGPIVTPPFTWNLGSTTSDHLCLAVEIAAPGDLILAPGLTGRAPGSSGTDPSVVADNNKAQRNLQVSQGLGGSNGVHHYAIVHNPDIKARDVVIGLLPADGRGNIPEGVLVEVVTSQGTVVSRPWRNWDRLTLPAMLPGENRWIGVRLPVGAAAQTVASLVELKGDRASNGFAFVVQSAPIGDVIAGLLADHDKLLSRLDQGFHIPAAQGIGTGQSSREREGLEFDEHVRVEAEDIRIEVDIRIRGGRRVGHHPVSPPPLLSAPANYERFVRSQAQLLISSLKQIASSDPFDIADAIAEITSAAEGDVSALVTAHATVLNKFDAFLTMLQKAQGDRADILQMVRWHRQLCQAPSLAALAATAGVRHHLDGFIARVAARTMQLSDYRTMLANIISGLNATAAGIGAAAPLSGLITSLAGAATARAAEKAHRDFLIALGHYV
jgi:hypothetical protein